MPGRIYRKILIFFLLSLPFFAHALININTASLDELDTLPGVGPTIAQRIVDGRPYAAVDEISRVQGIGGPGSSTYENIISLITVGDAGGGAATSSTSSPASLDTSTSYSSAWPIPINSKYKFEVSAGRDKVGVVGSPIEFKAEINFGYARNNYFQWNFGNGEVAYGPAVTYTYSYPGDYAVTLTVTFSDSQEATARLNAKITDPKLAVTLATPERIEITNSGQAEANLYGRAMVVGESVFLFPKGTIIKAGQSISFSSKVTGLTPTAVSAVQLFAPGTTEHPKIGERIQEEKAMRISALQDELGRLESALAAVRVRQAAQVSSALKQSGDEPESLANEDSIASTTQTAAAVKSGWWGIIKKFFMGGR